ncbi:MAG: GNAT family protein [Steroidobacteraceae bacterium]
MSRWISAVQLQGNAVALEPLSLEHREGLLAAINDGELWRLWFTSVPDATHLDAYIETALDMRERLSAMPFVVREKATGEILGTTRYCNVDEKNQRLEIGYTFYAQRVQRTSVNTECKLLLLTHAFEQLRSIAVEFRTHWMNHRSRRAIERLGAKQDGILRNHQRMPDGSYRDTVVYSIIESEWPAVKRHLTHKLAGGR